MTSKNDHFDHGHLADGSAQALALTQFELAIERLLPAYAAWKSACMEVAGQEGLTAEDISVLNAVHSGEIKMSEVAQLLNRADTANVQYSIRKLTKLGLVEKTNIKAPKNTRYQTTHGGAELAQHYAELREYMLVQNMALASPQTLQTSAQLLQEMTAAYAQATALAGARRGG